MKRVGNRRKASYRYDRWQESEFSIFLCDRCNLGNIYVNSRIMDSSKLKGAWLICQMVKVFSTGKSTKANLNLQLKACKFQ